MIYNYIIHPITKQKIKTYSSKGKLLLKFFIKKYNQSGGAVNEKLEGINNDNNEMEFDNQENQNLNIQALDDDFETDENSQLENYGLDFNAAFPRMKMAIILNYGVMMVNFLVRKKQE